MNYPGRVSLLCLLNLRFNYRASKLNCKHKASKIIIQLRYTSLSIFFSKIDKYLIHEKTETWMILRHVSHLIYMADTLPLIWLITLPLILRHVSHFIWLILSLL
ncbi:uncharacterized protein M6B38_280575 [Iris pallida]|uniref:Uncharacterized protein n=1 Tax=Iris pallida TaxID=29817 RepID=A0AAX6I0W6_IRIPA|nr:uncharacterized protein M6B38_280575 [Iris pallida]